MLNLEDPRSRREDDGGTVKLPHIQVLNGVSILGRSAIRLLLPLAVLVTLWRFRKVLTALASSSL